MLRSVRLPVRPLAATVAIAAAMSLAFLSTMDRASRAAVTPPPAPPNDRLTWDDKRVFALGANVPYITFGCDFGCPATGISKSELLVDRMLGSMSDDGVRVVRWYLFPGDAAQIVRAADGAPTRVRARVTRDIDVLVRLAKSHDLAVVLVVLPSPGAAPRSWFTDPAQRAQLGRVLRPLAARYRNERHLLGWEVLDGADDLATSGAVPLPALRATARTLVRTMGIGRQLTSIGMRDTTYLDSWTGLGADYYAPHAFARGPGAPSNTPVVSSLVRSESVDAPVVIGAMDGGEDPLSRLQAVERAGYAGAFLWSWRAVPASEVGGRAPKVPNDALWRFSYSLNDAGPRVRPRNDCLGPQADAYRCPNLRMSRPSDVSLGRSGRKTILYSTNSLNSYGRGPVSLAGTRSGPNTMNAVQLLHRVSGSPRRIDTGAKLAFKAIPGQGKYWKWNGAARMELWRIDRTGTPIERTRIGPKTVYCLRDLKRTRGDLPRSPRSMVYPACNRSSSTRRVTLGTSVGWSDVYPASYHENWIDVTGLRGCFAYVHVADPDNVIHELNERDNTSQVTVKLPWTGSNRGCPGAAAIPSSGAGGRY